MPVDTNGGKAKIKGGYNDIGRDGHFTRYENSHNVNGSNVQGSFNTNSDGNSCPFVDNYACLFNISSEYGYWSTYTSPWYVTMIILINVISNNVSP
jgi:hypothetical protein